MHKDLEVAKSRVQTSSERNREHRNQIKTLSEEGLMLREKFGVSGKMSLSMKDSTTLDHSEAIHELRMTNISLHGSLNDKEKSLDKATLILGRDESQVMRLIQQFRDLHETVNDLQDAEQFKDPESATTELSGQTFTCASNRNHVSGASVQVEKAKPDLGASANSFSKVPFAAPLVPPTAASTAAAFQAAALLQMPKEITSKEVDLVERNPLQRREKIAYL